MVPQGQDIIPRRPCGGTSCKGIILRRPHGDASLLGRNSTVSWWCLIECIQIVKFWCLIWFWCLVCLPFMPEYEIVCWVYDLRTFSLAYPLLICMIVYGFFLCDDHQPCWCEQMWEPLAVVIIEMLRFDDTLGAYQAHYGGLSIGV